MTGVSFLIAVLTLLTSVCPGQGQSWKNVKGIGVRSGVVKFLGDTPDRAALGEALGASLQYGPTHYLLLELEAGYGSFKPSIPGSHYKKDPNDPYRTFFFPATMGMRLTPSRSVIKPYLTVGGGVLFWDLRHITDSSITFYGDHKLRWGQRISGLRKNLLLYEGAGLQLFPFAMLGIDLGARFSSQLQLRTDNTGHDDINSQILEAYAGLNWYFGFDRDRDKDGIPDKIDKDPTHPEDRDGFQDDDGVPDPDNDLDGIPDTLDKAPLQPEDKDGFQDEDGIPDLDNDQDGIPDVDDQCPFEPEDIDGFQDSDGCPDIDNDGDGILDALDACPNEAEDLDGFQDNDGCPDPDNDADGIPDVKDKCPNQPETLNGYEDEDGCPDEVMQLRGHAEEAGMEVHFDSTGARLTLPGIKFKSGSAALTQESYAILDDVVKGLKSQPDVMIEVRGFTDNIGSEESNQKLSEQRARAVLKYLINRGIPSKRLRAMGLGELDPVASNDSATGRAQNRRIEFLRVK